MGYIIDRLKEASTWRGVFAFAGGAFGFSMSAELQTQVIAAGVAVSGLLGMILPDLMKAKKQ